MGLSTQNATHNWSHKPFFSPCPGPHAAEPALDRYPHLKPPSQPESPPPMSRNRHPSLQSPRISGGPASLELSRSHVFHVLARPPPTPGPRRFPQSRALAPRFPDPSGFCKSPATQTQSRASGSPCWMSPLLPPGMGTLSCRSGSGRQRRQKE